MITSKDTPCNKSFKCKTYILFIILVFSLTDTFCQNKETSQKVYDWRNSGFIATPKSTPAFLFECFSKIFVTTFLVVPGVTVLFTTTR